MTWATWIALAGVVVNLVFNAVNFFSNRKTRRNAAKLSDFNSSVKNPITDALNGFDAIMDEADDIARSSQQHADKVGAAIELSKRFHAARRILARRLNDCDTSQLVAGNDWGRCDEGHMDTATQAFDEACKTNSDDDLRRKLLDVATAISSLRKELRQKLDTEVARLMG